MFFGNTRGSRTKPPAEAIRERLTSGSPNRAAVLATIRSHANANSVPPANAGPSTAAIKGLILSRATIPPNPPLFVAKLSSPAEIALRSAPAENAGPFAHRIPVQRFSSFSNSSRAFSIPSATSWLTAFRASGRFNVIRAIRSLFSN